ncbi:hypothetical protein [Actinomyces gaoshouyii]|uniref:Uncharacterized protein n=1 Tax=Actinomyces gaoshouyii TaxID=1960083 RepID=A0A8H9LET6_9ACTO|nr:hypothetical protein [Actinomyces gaoshouyii]GGO97455.1 hypothetical protein GCM10011612_10030 [Actinomyces gaoshouyii]
MHARRSQIALLPSTPPSLSRRTALTGAAALPVAALLAACSPGQAPSSAGGAAAADAILPTSADETRAFAVLAAWGASLALAA